MLDRYIVCLKGTVSRLSSSFCWFYHLHFLNDLNVPEISTWKYVDDSTIAEIAPRGEVSHAQSTVDTMRNWSRVNMMQLNAASKCKELLIDPLILLFQFQSAALIFVLLTMLKS